MDCELPELSYVPNNPHMLIIVITYYCELYEGLSLRRLPFHQSLTSYLKDINVAVILKEFHQVEKIKEGVMLASVGGV